VAQLLAQHKAGQCHNSGPEKLLILGQNLADHL